MQSPKKKSGKPAEKRTMAKFLPGEDSKIFNPFAYIPNTKEAKTELSLSLPSMLRDLYVVYKETRDHKAIAYWSPLSKNGDTALTKMKETYLIHFFRDIMSSPGLKTLPPSGITGTGKERRAIFDHRILGLTEDRPSKTQKPDPKTSGHSTDQINGVAAKLGANPLVFNGNIDPAHWAQFSDVLGKPSMEITNSSDINEQLTAFSDLAFMDPTRLKILLMKVKETKTLAHFSPERLVYPPKAADPVITKSDSNSEGASVTLTESTPVMASQPGKRRADVVVTKNPDEVAEPAVASQTPGAKKTVRRSKKKQVVPVPPPAKPMDEIDTQINDYVPDIANRVWSILEEDRMDILSDADSKKQVLAIQSEELAMIDTPDKARQVDPDVWKITRALFDNLFNVRKEFSDEVTVPGQYDATISTTYKRIFIMRKGHTLVFVSKINNAKKTYLRFAKMPFYFAFMRAFHEDYAQPDEEMEGAMRSFVNGKPNDLFREHIGWIAAVFDYLFPLSSEEETHR